ncbi:TetR/AcrR family transcriptional regulator [Aquirhabdus sp.]|uniref:TetR/AcrR family transcriptional regulator n=1 Tax=Aquirhabdus sp. TaxID=2824160 RepID=UPI00396C5E92
MNHAIDFSSEKKEVSLRVTSQQETRKRLLEAAHHAVANRGYEGTSISDIVNLAGFTKGAFFSNFENKESILLELMRLQKEEDINLLGKLIAEANGDIAIALNHYIASLDERHDCAMLDIELQLYARSNPTFAKSYHALQETNRVALGQLLETIFAMKGKLPPIDSAKLADLFVGLVQGLALQHQPNAGLFIHLVLDSLMATAPVLE